jgi:drug/metabolite transporter (DMT)-like permease
VLWFTAFDGRDWPVPAVYGEAHDARQWLILIALGLRAGSALFPTSSLRFAPVSVVPFDYSSPVRGARLVWDTHPPSTTWAGAAVIIASGLYTLYREHKLGRDKAPAATF